jgi:hypothetical protein
VCCYFIFHFFHRKLLFALLLVYPIQTTRLKKSTVELGPEEPKIADPFYKLLIRDTALRVRGRQKIVRYYYLVSRKQSRDRKICLLSRKRDLSSLTVLIMQMVRYHSRPN